VTSLNHNETLVRECRINNPKAQELFFKKFYPFAMQVALRYSRDEHDAADILVVSFTRIFRSIHSFNPDKGSLQAWISRIVINEALTQLKKRERFIYSEINDKINEPKIQNEGIEKLGATELLQLIRTLPAIRQAIFNLYVVEGYSHEEISMITGIKAGTCKWHLHEARKELQQHLLNRKAI